MIEKNEPELIEDSFLISFNNNIIPIQDKQDKLIDEHNISNNKIKKQKEFLNKKNKMFFNELEKLYTTNILLKNKLNEVLNEKKRLNQLIIKLEQQIKLSKKINSENNKNNLLENGDKKDKMSKIELYRKKKRKRRKKNEIKNSKNLNCGNNKNNMMENDEKKDKLSNIELYRKKKRKRRKKNEIKNIYNCTFSNCGKSYPSKGSLNMHIKLKHQNEQFYNFDKGLIKD